MSNRPQRGAPARAPATLRRQGSSNAANLQWQLPVFGDPQTPVTVDDPAHGDGCSGRHQGITNSCSRMYTKYHQNKCFYPRIFRDRETGQMVNQWKQLEDSVNTKTMHRDALLDYISYLGALRLSCLECAFLRETFALMCVPPAGRDASHTYMIGEARNASSEAWKLMLGAIRDYVDRFKCHPGHMTQTFSEVGRGTNLFEQSHREAVHRLYPQHAEHMATRGVFPAPLMEMIPTNVRDTDHHQTAADDQTAVAHDNDIAFDSRNLREANTFMLHELAQATERGRHEGRHQAEQAMHHQLQQANGTIAQLHGDVARLVNDNMELFRQRDHMWPALYPGAPLPPPVHPMVLQQQQAAAGPPPPAYYNIAGGKEGARGWKKRGEAKDGSIKKKPRGL